MVKRSKKDIDKLVDALSQLPANWLACRDMRHAWEVTNDFHVAGNVTEINTRGRRMDIRRVLTCVRCETARVEHFVYTAAGLEKTGAHYTYPDEYQIKGVPRGVKPQSLVQGVQYQKAMERAAEQAREQGA